MSSQKISQLTRDNSPAITDIIPTVKDPGGTPLNRAISLENLINLVEAETIGTSIQAYDADTLKADTTDELAVGYTTALYSIGTIASGAVTPSFANGGIQTLTNNGAFTLNPPSTGNGSMILEITNGASAGAITTSGFNDADVAGLTTVNGHHFICQIIKIGSRSSLYVRAAEDNA